MTPEIIVTDMPSQASHETILSGLLAFNEAKAGPANYLPLAVLVKDKGKVAGGLWGATGFDWLFVQLFYLPEALRGAGIGSRVLRQAEEEAQRRGCRAVWLDTFSFQARGFYERQGYTVFGTLEDYPPGHRRFFLKKALAA